RSLQFLLARARGEWWGDLLQRTGQPAALVQVADDLEADHELSIRKAGQAKLGFQVRAEVTGSIGYLPFILLGHLEDTPPRHRRMSFGEEAVPVDFVARRLPLEGLLGGWGHFEEWILGEFRLDPGLKGEKRKLDELRRQIHAGVNPLLEPYVRTGGEPRIHASSVLLAHRWLCASVAVRISAGRAPSLHRSSVAMSGVATTQYRIERCAVEPLCGKFIRCPLVLLPEALPTCARNWPYAPVSLL